MWTIGKEFPPFVQARNLSREKLHTMTGMEAQHNETEAAGKPAAKKTTRTRKPRASKQATFIAEAPAMPIAIKEPGQFGRVNILNCQPSVEDDVYAARVEIGEQFTVSAQVFMEGRTKVGATAVLKNPRGRIMARVPMTVENAGLDLYTAKLQAGEHSTLNPWDAEFAEVKKQLGNWRVAIEGWEDTYGAWLHDARIKVDVLSDVENTLTSGSELLTRWASTRDANLNAEQRKTLREAAKSMMDTSLDAKSRLTFADNADIEALHETNPLRDGLTSSGDHVFHVERPKSSFSAWYQFFPRSEGAYLDDNGKKVQGNFHTAVSGLERAKAEGFNIVYLPPIFPIGVTNRKGPDGALNAGPDDPGSPFGIGSELGGHDTVDPLLGTMDDFKAFCQRAHELNLEVALDFALQCSPDHPWVKEHPNWFRTKPDGSIAYAENPPKKYQDIYPIDFDNDLEGIEREVERIMNLWIDAGVTIFRVDNPHTKPVRFWQDVIAAVTKKHPEVLFLAEAFTRPAMVRALSYAGFTQSHCYFPWRNTKPQLEEFLQETNGKGGYYQHNTFWPTTPDILTAYVRDGGVAAHAIRAVLAALGSPSWGIYNGYELIENRQRADAEEQSSNEKFEIKVRDWSAANRIGIAKLLTSLNEIRSKHAATTSYHNLTILPSANENIIAFARQTEGRFTKDGRTDTLIVVVNLDPYNEQQSSIHVDAKALGLPTEHPYRVKDQLTGREYDWSWDNFVSLAPWADVAHVFHVETGEQPLD